MPEGAKWLPIYHTYNAKTNTFSNSTINSDSIWYKLEDTNNDGTVDKLTIGGQGGIPSLFVNNNISEEYLTSNPYVKNNGDGTYIVPAQCYGTKTWCPDSVDTIVFESGITYVGLNTFNSNASSVKNLYLLNKNIDFTNCLAKGEGELNLYAYSSARMVSVPANSDAYNGGSRLMDNKTTNQWGFAYYRTINYHYMEAENIKAIDIWNIDIDNQKSLTGHQRKDIVTAISLYESISDSYALKQFSTI